VKASLNPYAYVQNNPLTWTDPNGACIDGRCFSPAGTLFDAVGQVWDAATSDSAIGVVSFAVAAATIGFATVAGAEFLAGGGLVTMTAYGTATSVGAAGAYALTPLPSDTGLNVLSYIEGGFEGVNECRDDTSVN
jgi:hypothetical protein